MIPSYTKTTWQNGVTPINETNLNKIETQLDAITDNKNTATVTGTNLAITNSVNDIATITNTTNSSIQTFISGENIKNDNNLLNGYVSTTSTIITSSANSKSMYVAIQPNTMYYISKILGNKLIVALTDTTPLVGGTVRNVKSFDEKQYAYIYNDNASYLIITYWNVNDTATEAEIRATMIISQDMQNIKLAAQQSVKCFTYNEKTNIMSTGNISLTYNKQNRLANNDDLLDILNNIKNTDDNIIKVSDIIYPTLLNGENYNAYGQTCYYRKGNKVVVHIGVKLTSTSTTEIFVLPADLRPKYPIYGVGIGGSLSNSFATIGVLTTGSVRINTQSGYIGGDVEFDLFVN